MIYGVYANSDRVHWSPAKIFGDEIKVRIRTPVCVIGYIGVHIHYLFTQIIGSFAQTHCFPRAVAYLDSGKIKVKGMVSLPYHRIAASDRI